MRRGSTKKRYHVGQLATYNGNLEIYTQPAQGEEEIEVYVLTPAELQELWDAARARETTENPNEPDGWEEYNTYACLSDYLSAKGVTK